MPRTPRDSGNTDKILKLEDLLGVIADISRRHGNASGGLAPIPPAKPATGAKLVPGAKPAPAKSTVRGTPNSSRLKFLGPTIPVGEFASWVPPGTSVLFHDLLLPDGMIYVGQNLQSGNERFKEPALLNPSLRIGGAGFVYASTFDYSSYADWSPPTRRAYLEWLAGGRRAPNVMGAFISLFFFGLERRLLDSDPIPSDEEKGKIRAEMERLLRLYSLSWLARKTEELWAYLDFQQSPNPEAFYLDLDRLRGLSSGYNDLPPLLDMALWHFAHRKEGIPGPYAYQWLTHDPDYSPRTAASRCPDEMERIFISRYAEEYPKGVRPTLRKQFIGPLYQPMNHGLGSVALTIGGVQPRSVTRGPLKRLRELAFNCADLLGGYSRYVGRHGDDARDTIAAVSLLPEPLRSEHPTLRNFAEKTREVMNACAVPELEKVPDVMKAALVPAETLTALYNGGYGSNAAQTSVLTRAPLLAFLGALDTAGVVVEPDVRRAGTLWTAGDKVALTVSSDATFVSGEAEPNDLLHRAALSLLIAASGGPDTPRAELPDLIERVADLAALRNDAVNAPRLAALALQRASAPTKLMRRAHFAELLPRERDLMANFLTGIFASRMRRQRFTTAMLADATQLFTLIGCAPETTASRLHAAQTGDAEPWSRVQSGAPMRGYALPPAPPDAADTTPGVRRRRGIRNVEPPPALAPPVVTLDMAKVQAKIAESQQISALLHEIFTDDEKVEEAGKRQAKGAEARGGIGTVVKASAETPVVPIADAARPTSGPLSPAQTAFLVGLVGQSEWSVKDADALARSLDLLPLAAREALNDASFEVCGEALIEGDTTLEINAYALEQWKETYPLPL